jgi:WD40 repeat protein
VRTWRLTDLTLIETYQNHAGKVKAVAWHHGTRRLASSGNDGRVLVWYRHEQPRELPPPPTDAWTLTFSPSGRLLFGGGWFRLFQWHLEPAQLQVLATEHLGIIKSLDYSATDNTLASISRITDSAVYFLDPDSGKTLRRFTSHDLCGADVRLSTDGHYLASTGDDGKVQIWDLRKPRE